MGEIEVEEYIHKPVDGELRVDDYRIIEETLVFDKKVLKDDQGQILYLDSIGNVVAIVNVIILQNIYTPPLRQYVITLAHAGFC